MKQCHLFWKWQSEMYCQFTNLNQFVKNKVDLTTLTPYLSTYITNITHACQEDESPAAAEHTSGRWFTHNYLHGFIIIFHGWTEPVTSCSWNVKRNEKKRHNCPLFALQSFGSFLHLVVNVILSWTKIWQKKSSDGTDFILRTLIDAARLHTQLY